MADPFSILAGAAGLADVAIKTSLKLCSLVSEFKTAPALILALSNEITEISIVLERVDESRKAVESLGDWQHDAGFLNDLNGQLNNARTILGDLGALAAILSLGNSPAERFRWLRKKKHAAQLKGRLKAARERINELLVAHNPSLDCRIKLELHEVRIGTEQAQERAQAAIQTSNGNLQATRSELVAIRNTMIRQQAFINSEMRTARDIVSVQTGEAASQRQQLNDQLSMIRNTVRTDSQTLGGMRTEQTRHSEIMQTVQMAILSELAALSSTSMVTRPTGPMIQPISSHDNLNSVVFFSLRLRRNRCADRCPCRCHLPAQPNMSLRVPPMLRAAFGYLFLGYTGYPSSSARCNAQSCARGSYMRLQATYCFPLRLCLHYVVHAAVEASTSGSFTFTLVSRRRLPCRAGNIFYEAHFGTTKTVGDTLREEKGCIQDIFAIDGRSALDLALRASNPESVDIMKLLLQNGADPDLENDDGISFRLRVAHEKFARAYSPDYIRALEHLFPLLSCAEALGLSYIHKVVLGIIPLSLSRVLQKSVGYPLNAKDRIGCTPLMYAASHGNVVGVRALIDAGADVNEGDLQGDTALHYSIYSRAEKRLACVEALLQAGSDCNS
ncbi:hypothetical protein F4803DRAFT_27368 [Xylaria telfairii]|nr:hypothetical protein F4803DRAFT_27368 [Xylaria telfairii]